MKFIATIAILTIGIATAIPTLLEHRDDAAGSSSELKALPYGMKSEPDCPKYKYRCLHCDENDFNCITDPVCNWCRENDASWNGGSTGGAGYMQ